MSGSSPHVSPVSPFEAAVAALAALTFRPEVVVEPTPPPRRIAPFSVAYTAEVLGHPGGSPLGQGRFVLLYDPECPSAWGGAWRNVTYVRADVEPEMGDDSLSGDITWTWLRESLAEAQCTARLLGGTVTHSRSTTYGELDHRATETEIEVRASWSPVDTSSTALAAHMTAWIAMVCTLAGLPPYTPGVTALRHRLHPEV